MYAERFEEGVVRAAAVVDVLAALLCASVGGEQTVDKIFASALGAAAQTLAVIFLATTKEAHTKSLEAVITKAAGAGLTNAVAHRSADIEAGARAEVERHTS